MQIPNTTQEKIQQLQQLVEKVKELEIRNEAKDSLLGYAKFQMEEYKTPPHIKKLAEKLEAVERGEVKRYYLLHVCSGPGG